MHGVKEPQIFEYDSLTSEDHWNEYSDVILANPPFMSPKGGIRPHKRFSVQSNRSEVLFVDYIAEHLIQAGRAAVIVPEGIIFQSGKAYKQLRKMLVEKYLVGVISLPAGVFQPYSGVKTSILWLDKVLAKKTDKILFVKVENDGFDLGAQRRAVKGNDLPFVLRRISVHKDWISLGKSNDLNPETNIYLAGRDDISSNGDYNLSGEKYKVSVAISSNYPIVSLQDVCLFQKGTSITKKDAIDEDIPVIAGGQTPAYFHNKFNRVGQTITVSASGAYSGFVNYFENPIFASDCFTIKPKSNLQLEAKFLYNILKYKQEEIYKFQIGGGQPHVYPKHLEPFKIPLPPLSIQKSIVDEIDSYQKIIDGARQVVENYKPRIDIDPAWEMVRMGDVCGFVRGPFGGSLKKEIFVEKGYCVYEQGHAIADDFVNVRYYITEEKFIEMKRFEIKPGDLIMSCSGTMGKIAIAPPDLKPGIINQALLKLSVTDKIYNEYLRFVINSDLFQNILSDNTYGAAIKNVASVKVLQELKIPLPNINTQLEIVDSLQLEHSMIESNKQLISHYEQKIKDRIAKVWGE